MLKILNYVYEAKYLKDDFPQSDMLLYRNEISQVYNKKLTELNAMTEEPAQIKPNVGASVLEKDENPKVPSAIDLKETFETFLTTVQKVTKSGAITHQIIRIMTMYAKSNNKLATVAIEYVLPSLQSILENQKIGANQKTITSLDCMEILVCLMSFDTNTILKSFDVPKLLLSLVEKCDSLFEDAELIKKLEELVKAVFNSSAGVLYPSSTLFVKNLLKHPRNEFQKLGIFSLYCIALALQEKKDEPNLDIFSDDKIMSALVNFARDKQS